jgi:hypothetical protein
MKTLEETAEEFLIRQGCQRMDCDGENCNFFEDVQPKDLIEFANYQAERMYSEEDMEEAFTNGLNRSFDSDFDRWLEQFKKK